MIRESTASLKEKSLPLHCKLLAIVSYFRDLTVIVLLEEEFKPKEFKFKTFKKVFRCLFEYRCIISFI